MKLSSHKTSPAGILLTLFTLEGLAAVAWLLLIPSDEGSGLLFGLSASRLALLGVLLFLVLAAAYLAFLDSRLPFSLCKKFDRIDSERMDKWLAVGSVLLMAACFLTLQTLLAIYRTTGSFREFAYYERLQPMLVWLAVVGLQTLIWILIKNRARLIAALKENRRALLPTVIVFVVFLLITLFISITGIGVRADKYGWGAPGVPLMEWQIWFSALFALLAASVLGGSLSARTPLSRKDVFICLGIWLAAFLIWNSQPVPPGFFATPGRLPNNEIYPFSDGAFYDFYAQNIIIGNGYRGPQIPPRPLYILFLAIAHALVGQNYTSVVAVQTALLAFIPVVLYLLGRTLSGTAAGLAAASMAILRELTTILSTPFTDDVSNSKLLFADLPATLAIALTTLLVFLWLREPEKRGRQMAAGLAMGVLILVRTQSMLLLPVFFLVALIVYRKALLRFALDFGLFALMMGLTIAPWLLRNYAIAGQFIFDHPESQARVMAQRYDFNGDFASLERQPGEDTGPYSARLNASIKQTVIEHPLYVAQFVTAHFLNNEIDDLLIMPMRGSLESPRELIFPTLPFWQSWKGSLSPLQGLLLFANLLLICLGIGVSWKKFKILGLLPLLVNLTYNLSTAIARYSGWRYLLPVDWIAYFYFAIGLVALLSIIFHRGRQPVETGTDHLGDGAIENRLVLPPLGRSLLMVGLALLIGGSLLLAEIIVPHRYSVQDNDNVIPAMLANENVRSSGIDLKALSLLQTQSNAFIVKGRALYPRYYHAGEGEEKTAKTGYEPSPDARLVFLTASNPDGLTIFRTGTPPDYFPNGADVSIVGCQRPMYAQAYIIIVHGSGGDRTYISPDASDLSCKN